MWIFSQERYPEGHPKGGQFKPKEADDEGDRIERDAPASASVNDIVEDLKKRGMTGYAIGHTARVAKSLPADIRQAGALHDAVEDGYMKIDEVRETYGDRIADAVDAATRKGGETYDQFIDRVAESGPDAVTLKVADLTDNLRNVSQNGHPKGPERAALLVERYEGALQKLQPAVMETINDAVATDKINPESGKPMMPHKTWGAISDAMYMTMPRYHDVLDRDDGLDKVLGAEYIDHAGNRTTTDADREAVKERGRELLSDDSGPPAVIMGPPKKYEVSNRKVFGKYRGDWSRLQDTIRATVAVNDMSGMASALATFKTKLQDNGWEIASAPEDRYQEPLSTGYRDISFNVRNVKYGLVGEIQFNTKAMMRAKNEPTLYEQSGHDMYKEARKMERNGEPRNDLTPEQVERYNTLNQQMREVYGAAASQLGLS